MGGEQEAELHNPFSIPPFSLPTHNLKLSSPSLLKERAEGPDAAGLAQNKILLDQSDVPYWPLTSLEKPRVDWIREEEHYNVFGDICTHFPHLSRSTTIYDGAF